MIKEEICLGGEAFQHYLVGYLNGFFAQRGGNLNKPIFKSSNAWGVARGGGDVEPPVCVEASV